MRPPPPLSMCRLALTLGCALAAPLAAGESRAPRVLAAGERPDDSRLGPLRGEVGDFSFAPATSPEAWQERAARVRHIMRVTMGLWPMPTRTPLNAVIHGRRDLGDYTIEKVIFESVPGFYVMGNLYRPKGREGKRPAVLSPHGHFPGGRFIDEGRDAVRQKIAVGAERFEDGGRSFMQSRCVQLARMGCVVFHYDMIGYGDSVQIPLEIAHRFSRLRVQFKQPPPDGLYSAAALLRLHNPLGLHTYNSIRALDFLAGLPDVDPERIAVTGGSGGGTQTLMLCAVDDRPLVSVPVVIVSTTRQGGCTCENICGLRIGTYNLEFTALHAPKPLMLISADDATRTMAERGFPELQQHYQALGAADAVRHVPLLHFPHNYNAVSRTAMYGWVNKHLELGLQEPILERPYRRLTREELTVWDEQHPAPEPGPQHERRLLAWLSDDAQRQLAALVPRDAASLAKYREVVGGGWQVLLRRLPEDAGVTFHEVNTTGHGDYRQTLGLLRYRTMDNHHAELPAVRLVPDRGNGRTVVWIDAAGKAGLYADDGSLASHTRALLEAGCTVIGVDLLEQGESAPADRPPGRQRWLKGEEAFAGWTYCYNLPLFAQRVHDILATIAWAAENPKDEIHLIGLGKAGPLAAAALARAGGRVRRAAIDTRGFRFAQLTDVYDADFLPGAVKYGDVPTLLALAAPTKLWVAGEQGEALQIAQAAYRAAGKPENLVIYAGSHPKADAVRWSAGQ